MNQYMDQRLRPFVDYYQDNWSELIPMMDYAQFTLPHSSLGMVPPFEVVNGYPPRTSFDWQTPPATSVKEVLSQKHAKDFFDACSRWSLPVKGGAWGVSVNYFKRGNHS